jgi:GntR family transcriptional regulator
MNVQRYIPIPDQVENILLERIRSGKYDSADRFPSESQLSSEFGVSRATIRTALAALTTRGLVIRKPGSGTYLSKGYLLESGIEELESVLSIARRQGLHPQIKNLKVKTIAADSFLAERLAVSIGSVLTSIQRTITIDRRPISYHEDFVPEEYLSADQIDDTFAGSVLDLISQKLHSPIKFSVTEITAVNAEQPLSSLLGVPINQALILLKEAICNEENATLGYSINYFVPDRFYLRLLRRRTLDYSI